MTFVTVNFAAATLVAAALAGPLAASAHAGRATTATIAKEQRAAPVSSYGEVIAWSDYAQGTNRLYSTSWTDNAHGFASVIAGSDDDPSAPGSPTTVVLTGPPAFTATP